MEVIRNGKKMRLIPSLDGALYQFDGEKVEAIPVSAESLLSSTYKLGDDSMIVGSKDLKNFGVNLLTGEVQFNCGSDGCSNYDGRADNEPLDGSSIIVLTRSTQVVRSVDVKNGQENKNLGQKLQVMCGLIQQQIGIGVELPAITTTPLVPGRHDSTSFAVNLQQTVLFAACDLLEVQHYRIHLEPPEYL